MTPLQTLAATATLPASSNLFVTFAWHGHPKPDCVWAGPCPGGAVYFIFR